MEYRIGGGCYFERHVSLSRVGSDHRRPCPCPRGMWQRREQRRPQPGDPAPQPDAPATSAPVASAPVTQTPAPSVAAAIDLWPAPPDPMERTAAAGLPPGPKEYLTNHVHAHLDVFVDGVPVRIPAGIGIDTADPDVKRFDVPDGSFAYGGIEMCSKPCISPLHTHDVSGILHTESRNQQPNTLGEFFTEWGVALTDSCVGEFCSPKEIADLCRRQALHPGPASDRADRPPGDRDRDRHPARRDPGDRGFLAGVAGRLPRRALHGVDEAGAPQDLGAIVASGRAGEGRDGLVGRAPRPRPPRP